MTDKNDYYEVVVNGMGWVVYHLPACRFESKEEAEKWLEKNMGCTLYKVSEEVDDRFIQSITLKRYLDE